MAQTGGAGTQPGRDGGAGGGGGGGAGNRAGWTAGSMSKRFDGKDDNKSYPSSTSTPQVRFTFCSSASRFSFFLSELNVVFSFSLFSHSFVRLFLLLQEPIQVILPAEAPADEANALAAMFAQTSQQWQETQEQMAK